MLQITCCNKKDLRVSFQCLGKNSHRPDALGFYGSSFKSAGISSLGCLFSKCCLYVFGSGIWDLQTTQTMDRAFAAAAFWSEREWP